MRSQWQFFHSLLGGALALLLLVGSAVEAQLPPPAELKQKIDALILQLDDDHFQTREDAEKALLEIGEAAREAVAKASKSDQPEVRQRAGRILTALRRRAVGLRHVGIVKRDDLQGICGVAQSPDGAFLYAAAFQSSNIAVFRRDAASGALEHVQSLVDPAQIGGVTCVELSPDGKHAMAVAFQAKKVALLSRDVDAGTLSIVNALGPEVAPGSLLQFPINGMFSPDGKHLYAADDRGGVVAAFELSEDKRLKWLQLAPGLDDSLQGVRGVAVHPGGKLLIGISNRAAALTVLERDAATGKLVAKQVLRDGGEKAPSLDGAHGICLSPGGEHAYVTVGRFQGDQAVGAYRIDQEGKVALIHEYVAGRSDLVDFQGGNRIAISPDGRNVYACGTLSQTLACFERNPTTGELTFITSLRDKSTGAGADLGAADVDVSPDSRFVYVTLESEGAISVFERTPPK